jgi:hypothetical protein
MSERNTPKSEFHPEQISEIEQLTHQIKPIIKYENETLKEIHQLLDDTAEAIAMATTNTAPWPALILCLLQSLETHTKETNPFDERLVQICERIARRLNQGHW